MRLRLLSCAFVLAAACGGGEEEGGLGVPPPTGNQPGTSTSPLGGTSTSNTTPPGTGTPATPTGDAGTVTTGTGNSTSPSTAAGGLPCEVQTILKNKCQTCHGEPLMSGPMRLMTWADLQANSTAQPGQKVAARVKARITDTKLPMPPAGREALSADEKAKLIAYIDGGAKSVTETCTPVTGGNDIGEYLPPDSECEIMLELRAHGAQTANDTTPFEAPTGGDHYEIFWSAPTWTQKMHVIRIDPIIDNGAVLHHWLLYMKDSGSEPVGSHKPDVGLQSADSQLLSGWAPGNKSIPLGRDIGMQVIQGPQARFGIELHYNTNSNPPNRKDRSGARLCLTSKLRPKEAATHWLGTQLIASLGLGGTTDAIGTCAVQKESHIIAYSPHMHTMGRHMKSIVTKKSGGTEALTDKAFAFDDQQIFPVSNAAKEVVVQPGDTITTTCTYDGSRVFTFGPNTDQEMCYNFVVAWPPGSLSNGSPGVVGGKNTCIDLL